MTSPLPGDEYAQAVEALNAALTHGGSGAMRESALHDAANLARRALLRRSVVSTPPDHHPRCATRRQDLGGTRCDCKRPDVVSTPTEQEQGMMSNVTHARSGEHVPRGERFALAPIALCGRPIVNTMLSAPDNRPDLVSCQKCRREITDSAEPAEPEMRCPGCDCDPVGYAPHNGKGDCPPKSEER